MGSHLQSLAPHYCEFEPCHGSDFSSEEAVQLACGRSVVLPTCPLMGEIIMKIIVWCMKGHMGSSSTIESWKVVI